MPAEQGAHSWSIEQGSERSIAVDDRGELGWVVTSEVEGFTTELIFDGAYHMKYLASHPTGDEIWGIREGDARRILEIWRAEVPEGVEIKFPTI